VPLDGTRGGITEINVKDIDDLFDVVITAPVSGQVLQYDAANNRWYNATGGGGSGSVTSVSAGIGLSASPNPITGVGEISLTNTAVSAGSYTLASITVDGQGRIISASNGVGGAGTVTSAAVSGNNGITVAGSPINTQGVIVLGLGNITPTTINTGNISASTASFSGMVSANAGLRATTVSASGVIGGSNLSGTNTGDQTITLTGDVSGSGTGSFAATINPNSVTYAKIQAVSAASLLGNPTASAQNTAEITLGTTLGFTSGSLRTKAITGDVSAPANSFVTTINPGVVSPAKSTNAANTYSTGITVDGGGSVLTTGSKGFTQINYNCTITNWTVLADVSGSVNFDVKRATFSNFPTTATIIGNGNPPILAGDRKQTAAVSGWTSATITAGDVLEFVVSSVATITRANLILQLLKT
jgi:hypothetical protein